MGCSHALVVQCGAGKLASCKQAICVDKHTLFAKAQMTMSFTRVSVCVTLFETLTCEYCYMQIMRIECTSYLQMSQIDLLKQTMARSPKTKTVT